MHKERTEDLKTTVSSLLDSQIAFHHHALERLREARENLKPQRYEEHSLEGPRLPSILERQTTQPAAAYRKKQTIARLPEPSGFGLPGASSVSQTGYTLAPSGPTSLLGDAMYGAAGTVLGWRSASAAIQAQKGHPSARDSASMATSRFVQFLNWSMNSRGEDKKHLL